MDPELALRLEASKIAFEADILEIQYRIRSSRKRVSIEITMTEKHIMRITPIRRGPGGFAEWGTYRPNNEQIEVIQFIIHAHVEIIQQIVDIRVQVASFTMQAESLKRLIQKSLHIQLETTGKMLVPLKKAMKA
jgi:hypothetical protein